MSSKRDSNEISLFETKREETIKEQQQAENSSSEPEILNKDCAGEIFNLEIRLEQLKLEHSRVSEAHESMRKSLIEKQEAIRHEERTTEEDKTNLRSSHFQFTKGKGEYESLVEQHKQLTEENKNLSGLLAKRKEEVEEYEKSAGDLTQKAAILKKQGESLGQELENRMKILGGLNQEFAEASNVYSNFITKMDALKTELELNHTKIRVLEQYLMKHPKLMEKGKKEIPGLNFNL
jgi:chromosome segregation ATPase